MTGKQDPARKNDLRSARALTPTASNTKLEGSGTPFTSKDAENEYGGFSKVNGILIVITSLEIPYVSPGNVLPVKLTLVNAESVKISWYAPNATNCGDAVTVTVKPVALKLVSGPCVPKPNSFPPTIITVGEFWLLGEFWYPELGTLPCAGS
jgi:hypothetical protein